MSSAESVEDTSASSTFLVHEPLLVAERSTDLAHLLEFGRHREGDLEWIARPAAVVDDPEKGRSIRFDLLDPRAVAQPSSVKVWLQAIRAISLTATLTPSIAVLLYGILRGWAISVPLAVASIVGVLVLQIGVNLMNDVEDHRRLIDLPGTLGGAGVIQQGWLSARKVRIAAWVAFASGIVLGVPALLRSPSIMLIVGVLAVVGGVGYSWSPVGLKYKALGDLAVLLLCGPALTIGFALAAFGTFDVGVVLVGGTFGLAAVGILHCNNLQDIAVDRSRGAATVATLLGEGVSRVYLVALYVLAFSSWGLAWALAMPRLPLPALLVPAIALLPTANLLRSILTAKSMQDPKLALVRVTAAQTHLAIGALLCIGLGISLAIHH